MSRLLFDQAYKPVQHLVLYPPDRYEYRMSLVDEQVTSNVGDGCVPLTFRIAAATGVQQAASK